MPLFHGQDCPKRVMGFAIGLILLVSIIATITFTVIGVYFGIAVIALSTVVLWYILDQCADKLFTDPKYRMSKEEMERFGKTTIPQISK
ncbi:hypothetical protein [Methanoregula sp.]|jgi:hypothetical protein|uniref:hypothetical protein n=1 Tax=Methanoregula sp. TaxID=2052170 RepID=UPI002639A1D7|nr:hypothetical protein [Methanoregula sp.]MDD5142223.1 hypothetical protein [Methanoregula sp.]